MNHKSIISMLNGVLNWINVLINESPLNKLPDENLKSHNGLRNNSLVVIRETAVQPLTDAQRLTLLSLTIIMASISLCGNVLVLYVNFTRYASKFEILPYKF